MKVHTLLALALMPLAMADPQAPGAGVHSKAVRLVGLGLPAGMARADDPQQVAALYSEGHRQRVEELHVTPASEQMHPLEACTRQLAAYRSQLVEEQKQRKAHELELEKTRTAKQLAALQALKEEREREHEITVYRIQAIHAYHQWLQYRQCQEERFHDASRNPCHRGRERTAWDGRAWLSVNIR